MTFAAQVIDFHRQLEPNWQIPDGIDLIFPFESEETCHVFKAFFQRYFDDNQPRTFLFGINPGRFGAGVTGIPFTDPKILEEVLHIPNTFQKRHELSSLFIYDMIQAFGGPKAFYGQFYISAVCPLGFIAEGKNVNYYDDRTLQDAVEPYIIESIKTQLTFGATRKRAFSIGQGKNLKYLQKLNDKYQFFDQIIPLPHPRWVMQYRLKRKQEFINEYLRKLSC